MPDLIDDIAGVARDTCLFDGVSRLLVGCSGGGDSVALLDILERLAPAFDLRLAVAHLHHGWRGEEADADQRLAERLAEDRGLPFFSHRVDLGAAAGSREEAARDARLRFFNSIVGTWGADAVALGHTADDQLETIILHLARGAGRRGLGGMRNRTRVGDLLIVRPLLGRQRAELRAYATTRSLEWREDSSNEDISLARNRLRRRLLSDLQQINPAAVGNVARAASLLQAEEEWLDTVAAEALAAVVTDEEYPGAMALNAEAFAQLPRPLQRRVVRRVIEEVRGHCRGISHEHVEWVVDAADVDSNAARDLPGVRVRRERDVVRFLPLHARRLATPKTG
jgi:tRNA(Ile)-lysidine synthase